MQKGVEYSMDWINIFLETEKLFDDICNLTKEDNFKKIQIVELFTLTSLLICRENLGAINVLLKNKNKEKNYESRNFCKDKRSC